MKANQIYISQFEFVTIKELEINREIGEHASAVITGLVKDENVEEYRKKLLEDIWVTISAVSEENGNATILMTGVIAGFSLEMQPHQSYLTLKILSGSFLMDRNMHFRSFQNASLSYMDVLKVLDSGYEHSGIIGEESIHSSIGSFLLQYQETDWNFVRRLASRLGLFITPSVIKEGAYYYFGAVKGKNYTLQNEVSYTSKKLVGDYMKLSSNGLGSLQEQDYIQLTVTTREIYDLWDYVTFQENGGYVYQIHSEFSGEELVHTYSLRPYNGMRTVQMLETQKIGCSFEAIVKDVKQDVVQIDIIGDENSDQEITNWFTYSTVYSTPNGPGWYCMPEVGDYVRLYIPEQFEETGYVISAVHKESAADRQNPDYKSLKTKYGKQLLFTPDSIKITNNDGMQIEILDNEGIYITSNRDIKIQSAGSMTISSDASLMVAGTSSVDIQQSGASIHMDDDISFSGGKFRIQ